MQMPLMTKKPATDAALASPVQLLIDDAFITKAADCVKYARRRIWITAYTWRWYENAPERDIQKFNYYVARAVKNGVDVRGLLDDKSQALYLRGYGIKCKTYPTDRRLHTKAILVDDDTLIIGSHNLTHRAQSTNYEMSVYMQDAEAAMQYAAYFERMYENFGE